MSSTKSHHPVTVVTFASMQPQKTPFSKIEGSRLVLPIDPTAAEPSTLSESHPDGDNILASSHNCHDAISPALYEQRDGQKKCKITSKVCIHTCTSKPI